MLSSAAASISRFRGAEIREAGIQRAPLRVSRTVNFPGDIKFTRARRRLRREFTARRRRRHTQNGKRFATGIARNPPGEIRAARRAQSRRDKNDE